VKFKLAEHLPASAHPRLSAWQLRGMVVLRTPDRSTCSVTRTISDLASLTGLATLAGSVTVLQRGLLRIRHP
jgi:hypothetical protein